MLLIMVLVYFKELAILLVVDEWISKFESNPTYTYRIIPKQSYKKEPIVR